MPDLILELAGPGGAGKSTLLATLHRRGQAQVLAVPPTKSRRALISGIIKASRLMRSHRLGFRSWLSLARNCATVEHAIDSTADLRGLWVIDEGPLRCLRERRCHHGPEFNAWSAYARGVIGRMAGSSAQLIVLELDQQVRMKRWMARTQAEDARRRSELKLRSRLGLFIDARLGFRVSPACLGSIVDELIAEHGGQVHRFTCGVDETPEMISDRFAQVVLQPISRAAVGKDGAFKAAEHTRP